MTLTKTTSNTHTKLTSNPHRVVTIIAPDPPPPPSPTKLPPLPAHLMLAKPPNGVPYSTKWQCDNPNPKSAAGRQAYMGQGYGGYGGMGGGYPGGMMGGMPGMGYGGMGYGGMGMGGMGYGGMSGMGMGMGPMGYGGMGMGGMPGMYGGGGYGMPRYGGGGMYGGGMGSMYGGGGFGMDPYYGMPPAAMLNDDFTDAHRIEHAYRQSAPDNYGMGVNGLPGGMGMGTYPGTQMMLYGRGMGGGGYGGWYA